MSIKHVQVVEVSNGQVDRSLEFRGEVGTRDTNLSHQCIDVP